MFHDDQPRLSRDTRWAIAGLSLLSISALFVTAWILADFNHEQEIVRELTRHLPASDLAEANELAGELRLQSRLSIVLILNIVASGVALTLLIRAYISSERSLRKVRVLATDVLASLDQGVMTTNREGNILSINRRGRDLLGAIETGTEIAMTPGRRANGTHPLVEICQRVLASGEPIRDCEYDVPNGGNTRHLRAGCSILKDHLQRQIGTVIHVRDETEKTLIEQRLRRMERYIGLTSLASGLQHEIKNPLSALSLHIQLLKEAIHSNGDPVSIDESLEILRTETHRITSVLESFRDFASVAQLNLEMTDVRDLVRKIARLTEPQAQQQKIQIETDLPANGTFAHLLDPVRIEQVLLNLLVNSFAAMPDGGTVLIAVKALRNSIELTVRDSGCGIPKELHEQVFEPYFTTRNQGTGMGLALCDKIVRQHNGTIDFTTGPHGTSFSITLPNQSV